jgi:hypothetical protein
MFILYLRAELLNHRLLQLEGNIFLLFNDELDEDHYVCCQLKKKRGWLLLLS